MRLREDIKERTLDILYDAKCAMTFCKYSCKNDSELEKIYESKIKEIEDLYVYYKGKGKN